MEKHACLIFLWLMGAYGYLTRVAGNEVADNFISIDCGADASYVDDITGFGYQTDERSFPEGERNCYTLKPKQQKNYNYLIRAIFAYGNYDNKNQPPVFDLYLGVNFWTTVRFPEETYYNNEIIFDPIDKVDVCLVNIGQGIPFISALELRVLNNSIYNGSLPLSLKARRDLGSGLPPRLTRYRDDVYDRLWQFQDNNSTWDPIKATAEIILGGDFAYRLPSEVLRTAVQPLNLTQPLYLNWSYDATSQYYVFLHFAEIQKLPPGRKRIINVTFDDDIDSLSQSITLEYSKPVTLSSKTPTKGYANLRVRAAAESNAPPILNAFEIYLLVPQSNSPTDPEDVDAIMKIKSTYGLSRIKWQGDPCVPSKFAWDGLNCSSGNNNSRIISLNLSSSKLTGQIVASFANLDKLQSLDLSNNELTGQLPEFLAHLANLKFLNLTGNNLTGSIPKSLREKANLQLSVADNSGLCQKDSCKEQSL